jgi:peptidoglycan DL-endopeptidase CwlO
MIRLLAGISMLIAAAALSACGGDDEAPVIPVETTPTGATGSALDQDEFVDEADSLCAEANTALASISTTGEAGTQAAAIAEQSDIYDGLIDDIDALGPPPEDETTLGDYLDALASVVDSLDQQELAAERGETDQVESLAAEIDAAESEAQSAADDFGLRDCAEEGDTTSGATDTGSTDAGGTDTGAAPAPVTPTTPAPTTPAPAPAPEPAPAPTPAPPTDGGDTGGTEPGSGGVSP